MENLLIRTETETEILIDFNDFTEIWEENVSWYVDFTIFETEFNRYSYNLALNDETILYQGQQFIIKTCDEKSQGAFLTKRITATHIQYDCQYHRQYEARTKRFTIQEAVSWAFDGNEFGYTYEILGSFPSVDMENWGNGDDAKKMAHTIASRFGAVIDANNKHIRFIEESLWGTVTNHQLRYLYNTDQVNAVIDTKAICTVIKCTGKEKEEGGYYFQPFFVVTDNVEYLKKFGRRHQEPINDDRFNNKETMEEYGRRTLQDYPDISLTIRNFGDENIDKGDKIKFIYEPMGLYNDVRVVGYRKFPYSGKPAELTFSNSRKDIINIQRDIMRKASEATRTLSNASRFVSNNIPGPVRTATESINLASNAVAFTENGITTSDSIRAKSSADELRFGDGSLFINEESAINKDGINADYFYNTENFIATLPNQTLATPFRDGLLAKEDKAKLDLISVTSLTDLDQMRRDIEDLKGGVR